MGYGVLDMTQPSIHNGIECFLQSSVSHKIRKQPHHFLRNSGVVFYPYAAKTAPLLSHLRTFVLFLRSKRSLLISCSRGFSHKLISHSTSMVSLYGLCRLLIHRVRLKWVLRINSVICALRLHQLLLFHTQTSTNTLLLGEFI